MAIDTETKRRSMLGMSLMFLVVAPVPDGTLSSVDRLHIIGFPGTIAPASPGVLTTAIHILSTGTVSANHAADSGNNLLIADTLEVQGTGWFGGASNYTKIDSSGKITFVGTAGLPYGGMFLHSGGVTINCPIGGAFVKITGLGSVGLLNNVTYNASALRVGVVGVYKVSWSCDADAAVGNKDFEFAVFLNLTEVQQGSAHSHSAPTAGDEFAVGSSCLIDVTSTAHDIDLRVRNITDDTDIDILDVSFNIIQIGGT